MLFKKTLKVASATALWMVALLGVNSAMAQDLEDSTYSAETLDGAGPTYAIQIPDAAELDAEVPVDGRAAYFIGEATAEEQLFIRVAANGVLRFAGPPAVAIVTKTGSDDPEAQQALGDAVRDPIAGAQNAGWRYAIGPVTLDANERVVGIRVTITGAGGVAPDGDADASVTGIGDGGVTIAVYNEQADAHFGEGTPLVSGSSDLLRIARSVKAASASGAVTPVTQTASAISRFTSISRYEAAPGPYEVSVGGFLISVNGTHLDADTGAALGGPEASPTTEMARWTRVGLRTGAAAHGSTRFYGDGGWAFASGFRFSDMENCALGEGPDGSDPGPVEGDGPGIASSPVSEEDATDDVIGAIKEAAWYLCVTISNENEEEIPAGNYLMDVSLSPPLGSTRSFPPQGRAGVLVGRILHDGTTVRIPFVTSYEGYTQRIVIVNRNKVDVGYAITFHVEGDGELTGDNPHEGMAMADQATVLKVADLVTLTDPTRAAATLTVAARSGTIDVATTMVNKMDQSTDTVVLMAE